MTDSSQYSVARDQPFQDRGLTQGERIGPTVNNDEHDPTDLLSQPFLFGDTLFESTLTDYSDPVQDFSRFMDMVSSTFDYSTMAPFSAPSQAEAQPINVGDNQPRVPDGVADNGQSLYPRLAQFSTELM